MWQMPELEKILKGIQEWAVLADNDDVHVSGKIVEFLLCKYMNDGWILIDDKRLWDILFEEACVEGEQKKRIYDRLKEFSSNLYPQGRSKEEKIDAFVNEIKKLRLKHVFEVVVLADKYNLDRNDVFKQYAEATISDHKTVNLDIPK